MKATRSGIAIGLALALPVLTLGTVATAQSPSPEATPMYVPEDVTSALPSRVGSVDLDINDIDVDQFLEDTGSREDWTDMLLPLGKRLEDVSMAGAIGQSPEADTAPGFVAVIAFRVEGVPGIDILPALTGVEPDPQVWQEVAGRRVMALGPGAGGPQYAYPHGEVVFAVGVVGDVGVTVEDVLAGLP